MSACECTRRQLVGLLNSLGAVRQGVDVLASELGATFLSKWAL